MDLRKVQAGGWGDLEPQLPVGGGLGPHPQAQHWLGAGLGSVVSVQVWEWILGAAAGASSQACPLQQQKC